MTDDRKLVNVYIDLKTVDLLDEIIEAKSYIYTYDDAIWCAAEFYINEHLIGVEK